MKKTILVLCLAIVMVATTAGIAFAGNTEGDFDLSTYPGTDLKIHSGYATSTNACKACHDVHGNTNYKLFIANTVSAGCSLCHVAATAAPTVYDGATTAHRIDAAATVIPDGSVNTPLTLTGTAQLDCMDCHSAAPHGVGQGVYGHLTPSATQTDFCVTCHDENDGRVAAGVRASDNTHVMVAVGDAYTEFGAVTADHADALATSAICRDCHSDAAGDFPHTGNFKLLKAGADVSALDTVCRDCHGDGVGVTY